MNKKILYMVIAILLSGCAGTDVGQRQNEYINIQNQALREMDLNDGVSFEEASIVAAVYFRRNISVCGVVGDPVDNGTVWVVTPYFGVAGMPLDSQIIIDKETGKVTWEGGPSYMSPIEMLELESDDRIENVPVEAGSR